MKQFSLCMQIGKYTSIFQYQIDVRCVAILFFKRRSPKTTKNNKQSIYFILFIFQCPQCLHTSDPMGDVSTFKCNVLIQNGNKKSIDKKMIQICVSCSKVILTYVFYRKLISEYMYLECVVCGLFKFLAKWNARWCKTVCVSARVLRTTVC